MLTSPYVSEKVINLAKTVLKPKEICITTIGNSHLTGLFSVANSHGIALPSFVEKNELRKIELLGLSVYEVDERFSAIKNNFLVNDKAVVINEHIPKKEYADMSKCFGVTVCTTQLNNLSTIGAVNVVTNKGLLAYNKASERELHWLANEFKVRAVRGTCNFGSVATGLGIVANSHGALVGASTSGFEMSNVFQALSGE